MSSGDESEYSEPGDPSEDDDYEDDDDGDDDFEPAAKKRKTKQTAKKPAKSKAKKPAAKKKATRSKAKEPKSPKKTAKRKSPTKSSPKEKPKAKKPKTVSQSAGEKMILEYLIKQNRPYSHINVHDNLHGQVKKTMVPKILDKLAKEDKIVCKLFKKTKIFHPNQDELGDYDQSEIDSLDANIKTLGQEKADREAEVRQLNSACSGLSSVETNEQADEKIAALDLDVATKAERLEKLEGGDVILLSDAEIAKIQSSFDRNFRAWRKRKRITTHMVETMLGEESRKTPKNFMKELDCETDEDYNVSVSDFAAHLS